ncbi:MAG: HDIG domain-containing protein [Actinomycetota bacterium]|nr:HDIG domain-containing protein [Actinomycetota bacterium]
MSDFVNRYRTFVAMTILAMTVVASSAILVFGYERVVDIPPLVAVGEASPERFVATSSTSEIEDEVKTEEERALAESTVEEPYNINQTRSQNVLTDISVFFIDLEESAFLPVPPTTTTTIPDTTTTTGGDSTTTSSTSSTTTLPPTTTTTTIPRRPTVDQVARLMTNHAILTEETIARFVMLHERDLDRVAEGESSVFPDMRDTAVGWATSELTAGVRDADLNSVQTKYLSSVTRPPISIVGIPEADVADTSTALGSLVARRLQANEVVDEVLYNANKEAARRAVEPQFTSFSLGEIIALEGETLTKVQVAAIQELKLFEPEVQIGVSPWAMAFVAAITVLLSAFLLWRIAPKYLQRPRDMILLAIVVGLAAAASRVPDLVPSDEHAIGYIIPAVAIGVMAAILFDQRTALLIALPMAVFTAVATGDIAYTVYAGIAAAIPVAFVSSVSTRSQLRLSVLGSAAVVAPLAAALELLFVPGATTATAFEAIGWSLAGAIAGGFIGQGLVSFLETAFGVTTTMSLLDLLDRNHPALQVLEEKAPGTFNHSMLVGSLAGRAARAIGADPLLAQAAAWYHDLGKTEHPQYFVENQLGHNPHDDLDPERSVEIIGQHVDDGLALAQQYRIPEDVADGIRMHHGTSLMRYFYHKALKQNPDVDPELFRHHGVKPTRREMAIVMISDATEAAARAYAQAEEPTEAGLTKLVDSIVGEKLEDGQFEDCALTFGELTVIKSEIVRALSAYYHARVLYPDFPSSGADLG